MATAARPLRRKTAARLITDLIERTRALNADDKWAYRIRAVVVLGSYARGAERPNDVDIACELGPRWTGNEQLVQEQVRREIRRQPFRNLTEWATWPKLEVFRFLKTRARGLSIHELEYWILQTTDHTVLFRDESETIKDC
jgi:predicted nucleotidyltransferase